MASAAPGFGLPPFRMNSNALEPARSYLVGHPPIVASSIALTNEYCDTPVRPSIIYYTFSTDSDFFLGKNGG
jgi:hypothetical protein